MAIYLVQHGRSLPKNMDPEKGLSDEGKAEVQRIAAVAVEYGIHVEQIRHSGKKRARQTADIFAAHLKPNKGVTITNGMDPLDDVIAFACGLPIEEDMMLVGHLPFMQRLTSYLILGTADPPVFRFQNGGIVCMDRVEDSQNWIIQWTLMPNIG